MPTFNQPIEPLGGITGTHLLENFLSAEQAPEFANALWYQPNARVWIAGGRSTGPVKAIAFYTAGGATVPRWRQRSFDSGMDSNFIVKTFDKKAHTYLGAEGIRVSGVLSTGSTSNKVYYSSDLGVNWTPVAIGSSSTVPVDNLEYESGIGSIATLDSAVYRGATYSSSHSLSVTMSTTIPRRGLAIRSTYLGTVRTAMALVIDTTTTARYTTNGTSWSTNTLPTSFSLIEWSEHRKTFVGLSTAGAIYENPDPSTSSWTLTSAGPFLTLGTFGSYLIVAQSDGIASGMRRFLYSLDGVTWTPMLYIFPNPGTLVFNDIVAAYRPKAEYPHQLGIVMTGTNNPNTHLLTVSG